MTSQKTQKTTEGNIIMRKTHLIALIVGVATICIFATDASAYYDPGTSRFLSRDPGPGGAKSAMQVAAGGRGGFLPRDPSSAVNQSNMAIATYPRVGDIAHATNTGPVRVGGVVAPQPKGRIIKRNPIQRTSYADGMNLYQYVHSNPMIHIDPSGLKSCFFQPWRAGSIDFKNCTSKQLKNFRLIPEDPPYDKMNAPSDGRNKGIDGFWHKDYGKWFKVAGFCHATITCDPPTIIFSNPYLNLGGEVEVIEGGSGFSFNCCCNACLSVAEWALRDKGTCGLYNDAGKTAHPSKNPFSK